MTIDLKNLTPMPPSPALANIDCKKIDHKLQTSVSLMTSVAAFNNASFNVFIKTLKPIAPGPYLDQNNQPIPGVEVRGTKPSTIQTGTVVGSALAALSKDPNIVYISGSTQMRPV